MYTICPLSGAAPRSSYLVVNVALYRGRGSHRGVLRGAVGRAVPILESLLGSESLVPAVQGAANPRGGTCSSTADTSRFWWFGNERPVPAAGRLFVALYCL